MRDSGQARPVAANMGRVTETNAAHDRLEPIPSETETIELWPLSQGEIDGRSDGFVDAVFKAGPQIRHTSKEDRASYVERVIRGVDSGIAANLLDMVGPRQWLLVRDLVPYR